MRRHSHPGIGILWEDRLDLLSPQLLASLCVVAEEVADEIELRPPFGPVAGVGGHKQSVADDDRARHPFPRELHLPTEVFCLAELGRRRLVVGGHTTAVGATEAGPIGVGRGDDHGQG